MNALLFLGGIAVNLVVSGDIVKTTLGMRSGGYYTTPVVRSIWRLLLRAHRRRAMHPLLSRFGPFSLLCIVTLWFVPLWVGTTMIYCAHPDAVVSGTTGQPADLTDRAYFAAYTLITLGMGDYVPRGGFWQLTTGVTATLGFFFVTLTITYLIPLLNSVMRRRTIAVEISSLGLTSEDILACAEEDPHRVEAYIDGITGQIAQAAQSYLAYPAIIYFHTSSRYQAFGPSIAALDRAADRKMREPGRCPQGRDAWCRARRAISDLLFQFESPAGVGSAGGREWDEDPCEGETSPSGQDQREASGGGEREAKLRRLVEYDGWEWEDLCEKDVDPLDC